MIRTATRKKVFVIIHFDLFIKNNICYVSDLEEGEKTLLLHEGEGKLSRVQSRLIYRFSKGSSVYRAGLYSGAEADRSGTVIIPYL